MSNIVANPIQRDALKSGLEITQRIYGHANPANLSQHFRVIGVIAHLGRQIKGHIQTGLPVGDHQLEAFVAFLRCTETGVLTGGPGS